MNVDVESKVISVNLFILKCLSFIAVATGFSYVKVEENAYSMFEVDSSREVLFLKKPRIEKYYINYKILYCKKDLYILDT